MGLDAVALVGFGNLEGQFEGVGGAERQWLWLFGEGESIGQMSDGFGGSRVTYVSARSWDASDEDMVKRGDWRDSEAAWTEATRSSQAMQKLVREIMVKVRV